MVDLYICCIRIMIFYIWTEEGLVCFCRWIVLFLNSGPMAFIICLHFLFFMFFTNSTHWAEEKISQVKTGWLKYPTGQNGSDLKVHLKADSGNMNNSGNCYLSFSSSMTTQLQFEVINDCFSLADSGELVFFVSGEPFFVSGETYSSGELVLYRALKNISFTILSH
ncbi:hypothetical protein QVD17_39675 [Tagetes erecta]|uniref:Uncharacterized protein n=1 Tax=Tagetes erecta TaxID=13708 RepID=A0AAD8NAD2_TARER|nr:hypothetical protein QVD17_39675 [Tagetes erecta]